MPDFDWYPTDESCSECAASRASCPSLAPELKAHILQGDGELKANFPAFKILMKVERKIWEISMLSFGPTWKFLLYTIFTLLVDYETISEIGKKLDVS